MAQYAGRWPSIADDDIRYLTAAAVTARSSVWARVECARPLCHVANLIISRRLPGIFSCAARVSNELTQLHENLTKHILSLTVQYKLVYPRNPHDYKLSTTKRTCY